MKRTILALLAALAATRTYAVSPPQYRQQRLLAASFGASPYVRVGEVVEASGAYSVDVTCTGATAGGISFLLRKRYDFGGIVLTVRVLDEHGAVVETDESSMPGDPVSVTFALLSPALDGNPLFDSFASGPFSPVVVLARPQVVQFWNDNLADPKGNETLLAADAFASCARDSVFSGAVRPAWSTASLPPAGGRLEGWVPAAAHSTGLYGSRWTTDLLVFGDAGTTLLLWFLPADRDNAVASPVTIRLAGPLTSMPDVLDTQFHAGGHGALRYTTDRPVRVVARTWTPSGDGTTGLFTPDLAPAEAAVGGTASATLQMGVDRRAGTRANVGLVNASFQDVAIRVEATLEDGTPAPGFSPLTVVLPPRGSTQVNDFLASVTPGAWRGLLVRARVLTAGGAVFGFLSEIENATNSACYQPATLR